MKDKEMIEEMAKDIHEELETENIPYYECDFMAQRLISKGWVKSNEDSAVLSREEQNQLYSKGFNDGKEFAEKFYKPLVRVETRKETIEKFVKECKKYKVKKFNPMSIDQRDTGISWIEMPEWKFDEFAKQFDVEIKE